MGMENDLDAKVECEKNVIKRGAKEADKKEIGERLIDHILYANDATIRSWLTAGYLVQFNFYIQLSGSQ